MLLELLSFNNYLNVKFTFWTQIPKQKGKGNPTRYGVENTCQLCARDNLLFAPPPIYCSSCKARIKRNLFYYWVMDESGTRHCFCKSCYKGCPRTGNISFQGVSISKAKLQMVKNNEKSNEENEESVRYKSHVS